MHHLHPALPISWLPDETLFSLCSRYHALSGNRLSESTCKALFGHRRQGSAHDFPARLDYFCRVAGPELGTVREIVESHTLLPLYLRFASPDLADAAITAAAANSAGALKFQLGLLTSRFRANHPLKACMACMDEDRTRSGTPYWHREHQIPGIWVCRRHGCWLSASDLKATGARRFHWVLPSAKQFAPVPGDPVPKKALQLAAMISGLVTYAGAFSPAKLRLTFRSALRSQQLLAGPTRDRLAHRAAGQRFAEFSSALASLDQLRGLPSTEVTAAAEVARLVGKERSGVHPIRYAAIAAWLFADFDEFIACYRSAMSGECLQAPVPRSIAKGDPTEGDARRQRLLDLLASGASVSGASRSIGVDVKTGMAWAASQGIQIARRPKVLKEDGRRRLVSLLRKGVSKQRAAEVASVSVETITNLLRTEVGLHDAWKRAQFSTLQLRSRRLWDRVTSANPNSGVKAARMLEPATYAWLYRNDRDWLAARTASMSRAVRVAAVRIDWDHRDVALADSVRRVALSLVEEAPQRHIRLVYLYQRLPDLKAKLNQLDKLPLTRAAIFDVVGRPRR